MLESFLSAVYFLSPPYARRGGRARVIRLERADILAEGYAAERNDRTRNRARLTCSLAATRSSSTARPRRAYTARMKGADRASLGADNRAFRASANDGTTRLKLPSAGIPPRVAVQGAPLAERRLYRPRKSSFFIELRLGSLEAKNEIQFVPFPPRENCSPWGKNGSESIREIN